MPRREGGIANGDYWDKTQWKTARLRGLRLALQGWAVDSVCQDSSLGAQQRGCATRLTAWLAGAQQCCAPTWGRLVWRRCGRTCRGLLRLVAWRTADIEVA